MTDTSMLALRADDLLWNDLDGRVVVLDLRTSKYLSLNEVGSTIWRHLTSPATTDQLVDAVVAEYAVERPQARADVTGFLGDLRRRGLVESPAG